VSVTVTPIQYTVSIVDQLGGTVVVSPTTQTISIASPGPQGPTGGTGSVGPKGDTGATGAAGSAASITVGSVATGTAGSNAVVTNVGTSGAAVFNFTIPRGDKGDTGNTGPMGSAGAAGTGVPVGGTAGQVLAKIDATNYNTQWITQSTPGTAATSGVYGVTTLTDATDSTSTTTAATPASVKSSYDLAAAAVSADNFHLAQGFTATTIETFARNASLPNSISWTSTGRVFFAMFTPVKNLTIGTASFYCVGTATTTTTARMGLYTWSDATGTATLVARTANDATLFGTAGVLQSRAFDTTGGYPATYTLTAGSAYAFGMIFVGTGLPNFGGLTTTLTTLPGLTPRASGFRSSQSDLATVGSMTDGGGRIWGKFS